MVEGEGEVEGEVEGEGEGEGERVGEGEGEGEGKGKGECEGERPIRLRCMILPRDRHFNQGISKGVVMVYS